MQLTDFDFTLPKELIAQKPAINRDQSSLLVPKVSGYQVTKFYNLINYLKAGDLLIFNNSKVINAKLILNKNKQTIEINLNRPIGKNIWLGFAKPSKKLTEGDQFNFDKHQIIIKKKCNFGEIEIEFCLDSVDIFDFLDQYGMVPLPQYIKRAEQDRLDIERYQNVYSQPKGSVAAATAGLHFTNQLILNLKNKGVDTSFVTLHVGAGTFLPVKTDNIDEHKMHTEWCEISKETADKINIAKQENRRVIVVGTTAMRTIESCSDNGIVYPQAKETDIFIRPGYQFHIPNALITNFHLPKSTLFMLVCAFSGTEKMKNIYQYAIHNKMRFFSYGDSMLIEKS